MADKAWKRFERRVASLFCTVRTALSGGNGKVSRSDSHHPELFISCKHSRTGHKSLFNLMEEEVPKADAEGKTVILAIGRPCLKGVSGSADDNTLLIFRASDIHRISEILGESVYDVEG